jgi:hypothetical protein
MLTLVLLFPYNREEKKIILITRNIEIIVTIFHEISITSSDLETLESRSLTLKNI